MTVCGACTSQKVHTRIVSPVLKKRWDMFRGAERQKQGRSAWAALDVDTIVAVANVWSRHANAPAYIQNMVDELFNKAYDGTCGFGRRRRIHLQRLLPT